MNRTKQIFRRVVVTGLCAAASLCPAAPAERPNILLITTDDQGLQVGCYGDPLARTPNLDRLASGGTRFTRGYVTQASCSPSRSSILTGLYPHQNGQIGLTNNYSMQDGVQTLPVMLKNAGYRTGIIGKLHVNPASAFPFDFWEMKNAIQTRYVRKVNAFAQKFMDADSEAPFFLMVNYFDPHNPYNELANQCDGLPENPYGPDDIHPFDFMGVDVPELRKDMAIYYNCVSRADTGIGMLLESLRVRGLDDNTLVIFLSDNGPSFTRGKATCYEAGLHVPFIIRYPKTGKDGQVCDELVSAVDLVPTILDAAGIESAAHLPGRSLLPLLQGEVPSGRKTLCGEFTAHGIAHYYPRRSICTRRFKLVQNLLPNRSNPWSGIGIVRALGENKPLRGAAGHYNVTSPDFYGDSSHFFGASADVVRQSFLTFLNPPEFELYDIKNDPYERINLYENPEYADVFAQLKAGLAQWQQATEDPFTDPDYLKEVTRRSDEIIKSGQLKQRFEAPKIGNW